MRFNRALLALPLLASCAAPEGAYPSLALRPAELGQFPPAPAAYVPPPPSSAALDRVERLVGEAAGAHRAFLAEVPATRSAVSAARGRGPDSDGWARAQVAISELQATRSPATIALADVDRIYADAATEGGDVSRVAQARERIAAQVGEQDRAIDSLLEALD